MLIVAKLLSTDRRTKQSMIINRCSLEESSLKIVDVNLEMSRENHFFTKTFRLDILNYKVASLLNNSKRMYGKTAILNERIASPIKREIINIFRSSPSL